MPDSRTSVQILKDFFEQTDVVTPLGGRKVTMDEIKSLSKEERITLAMLAAEELGEVYIAPGTGN